MDFLWNYKRMSVALPKILVKRVLGGVVSPQDTKFPNPVFGEYRSCLNSGVASRPVPQSSWN